MNVTKSFLIVYCPDHEKLVVTSSPYYPEGECSDECPTQTFQFYSDDSFSSYVAGVRQILIALEDSGVSSSEDLERILESYVQDDYEVASSLRYVMSAYRAVHERFYDE